MAALVQHLGTGRRKKAVARVILRSGKGDIKVNGRALAQEIMTVTPAIANLIREGKTAQMYSTIQTSSKIGMQTMEMALKILYDKNLVTYEDALSRAVRGDDFKRLVEGHAAVMTV